MKYISILISNVSYVFGAKKSHDAQSRDCLLYNPYTVKYLSQVPQAARGARGARVG